MPELTDLHRTRIEHLIEAIREHDDHFDMQSFFRSPDSEYRQADFYRTPPPPRVMLDDPHLLFECGSAACVAGWAVALFGPDEPASVPEVRPRNDGEADWEYYALIAHAWMDAGEHLLGFGHDLAERLFNDTTLDTEGAIAALEEILVTGDWDQGGDDDEY